MGSSATPPNITAPPDAPLFDKTGGMSKVWFWYLYQIFTNAIQIEDLQILEAIDAPGTVQETAAEDAQRLALIQDPWQSNGAAIDEVKKLLFAFQEGASQAAAIDELAKLLFAFSGATPPRVMLTGTAALRTATPAADGAAFYETDTGTLYVAVAGAWAAVVGGSTPGAWTPWTPATTPGGAMTYTGLTTHAFYQQIGKTVNVRLYISGTIGGTPANTMTITLPVLQLDDFQTLAAAIDNGGLFTPGSVWPVGASGIDVFLPASAVYAAGATRFVVQGTYEAA